MQVVDPVTGRALAAGLRERDVTSTDGQTTVRIWLAYPAADIAPILQTAARAALDAADLRTVVVTVGWHIAAHAVQQGLKPLPAVRNILAVASGKGGVGKSTTAANLALALAAQGARVGMLDADIYGPSVPTLLGIEGRPASKDNKTMEPLTGHGIEANSIGFLIDPESPTIWRGPMVTRALEQMLRQTNWGELDYLIVDMPPGTGDIALTLSQKVPVVGVVIVTTPQDLALIDARKGLRMFQKVNVPVLGVIENMAVHVCSQCGYAEHIFGAGGGARMAARYEVDWLGELPLSMAIREHADAGCPSVVADPAGLASQAYRAIARRVALSVAALPKDTAGRFPPIVVKS